MTRVKRGKTAHKRRKKVIKQTKGYKWRRSKTYRAAKEALMHALSSAYIDRRRKKREFRRLWQIRINAAVRKQDISYSKFIAGLKGTKIELDRKILAELAQKEPKVLEKIVEKVKS